MHYLDLVTRFFLSNTNNNIFVTDIDVTFATNPQNVTAELGQPATLHCEIDSVPSPHFTWRLNGLDLAVATVNSGQGLQRNSLSINAVSYTDAGEYTCVATNSMLGVTRFSYPGSLSVVGKGRRGLVLLMLSCVCVGWEMLSLSPVSYTHLRAHET